MKKPVTAADLMKRLNADPEFVAMRERKEKELRRRRSHLREAEAPLLADLQNETGLQLSSVWDLVNSDKSYPDAVPVLIRHLQGNYPARILAGIARSLADPAAKGVRSTLVREYRRLSHPDEVRDGLAVAIAATATRDDLPEMISLAQDKKLGPSRVLLIEAIANSHRPEAETALSELAGDPDLAQEIQRLERQRSKKREPQEPQSHLIPPNLKEVSAGLDLEQLGSLSEALVGIGYTEFDDAVERIQDLSVKQTHTFRIDPDQTTQEGPLFFRVRRSDIDAVDFWLFAERDTVERVEAVLKGLLERDQA